MVIYAVPSAGDKLKAEISKKGIYYTLDTDSEEKGAKFNKKRGESKCSVCASPTGVCCSVQEGTLSHSMSCFLFLNHQLQIWIIENIM